MTLSIIVPVYNVEDYIRQCLDSILDQEYKDFEIIVVDDGSTDRCGEICDQYSQRYPSINSYHKINGGLSSARNYGIEHACGDFIAFVDSDDWIKPTLFRVLMDAAQANNADVVSCRHIYFYADEKMENSTSGDNSNIIYKGLEAKRHLYTNFSFCGKLFKKELFEKVRFPEGKLYEDSRTMYRIALESSCYVALASHEYYYRQRPTSIMGTFSTQNYLDRVSVWDEIYNGVENVFPKEELTEIRRRQGKLALELLKSIVFMKKMRANRQLIKKLLLKLPKSSIMNYTLKDIAVISLCRLYSLNVEK